MAATSASKSLAIPAPRKANEASSLASRGHPLGRAPRYLRRYAHYVRNFTSGTPREDAVSRPSDREPLQSCNSVRREPAAVQGLSIAAALQQRGRALAQPQQRYKATSSRCIAQRRGLRTRHCATSRCPCPAACIRAAPSFPSAWLTTRPACRTRHCATSRSPCPVNLLFY